MCQRRRRRLPRPAGVCNVSRHRAPEHPVDEHASGRSSARSRRARATTRRSSGPPQGPRADHARVPASADLRRVVILHADRNGQSSRRTRIVRSRRYAADVRRPGECKSNDADVVVIRLRAYRATFASDSSSDPAGKLHLTLDPYQFVEDKGVEGQLLLQRSGLRQLHQPAAPRRLPGRRTGWRSRWTTRQSAVTGSSATRTTSRLSSRRCASGACTRSSMRTTAISRFRRRRPTRASPSSGCAPSSTHSPGGVDAVEVRDVQEPVAGSDNIIVAVAYAGLNRADILQRRGAMAPSRPIAR